MSHPSIRHPVVEGLHNIRDVGGYRAGDYVTRWNTLYRSDALHRLTDKGRQEFAALGISTVIDLRDDNERAYAPPALNQPIRIIANPIFQGVDGMLRETEMGMEDFYREMTESYGQNVVSAIRHIARVEQPATLVHCTAGKDRTGTTIALTLTTLGVDRDDVLHDYAETEQQLAGEWAERHLAFMESLEIELTPSMKRLLVQSPVEVIDQTLTSIERRFDSVPAYLSHHGLSEQEMAMLADRLLSSPKVGAD